MYVACSGTSGSGGGASSKKKQRKMSLIFHFFSVEVQNEIHSKIVSTLFDFHFPLSANLNFHPYE